MKRWLIFVLIAAGIAVAAYFYFHGGIFGFGGGSAQRRDATDNPAESYSPPAATPAQMTWRSIDRSRDGFSVELPAEPKDLEVPAYTETGSSEPVSMIFSTPDGDTTFAVSWKDNPPVARVNGHVPDLTLNMARDGMLTRTQTVLINETRMTTAGFPARDITSRNNGGGILNARIIYAGNRLYTLLALFPSAHARREQDVTRFFDSFKLENHATLQAVPTASPYG